MTLERVPAVSSIWSGLRVISPIKLGLIFSSPDNIVLILIELVESVSSIRLADSVKVSIYERGMVAVPLSSTTVSFKLVSDKLLL